MEQEGTYPLPEAQTDRFMMKVKIDYPSKEEEKQILQLMGTLGKKPSVRQILTIEDILAARTIVNDIYIDEKIIDYILNITAATRTPNIYHVDIEGLLLFGASPRASIALKLASKAYAFLQGRTFVTPQDVKNIAKNVLRHRLRITYEAEAENITADDIIDRIFSTIPVP